MVFRSPGLPIIRRLSGCPLVQNNTNRNAHIFKASMTLYALYNVYQMSLGQPEPEIAMIPAEEDTEIEQELHISEKQVEGFVVTVNGALLRLRDVDPNDTAMALARFSDLCEAFLNPSFHPTRDVSWDWFLEQLLDFPLVARQAGAVAELNAIVHNLCSELPPKAPLSPVCISDDSIVLLGMCIHKHGLKLQDFGRKYYRPERLGNPPYPDREIILSA
jgi:hypothetical protein